MRFWKMREWEYERNERNSTMTLATTKLKDKMFIFRVLFGKIVNINRLKNIEIILIFNWII